MSEPTERPAPPPKRRPGGQPGNQSARTHGAYSTEAPATLDQLHRHATAADLLGDVELMRRAARLLRHRGDRLSAHAMQLAADALEAEQLTAAGAPPRRRRRRVPPAGWSAHLAERQAAVRDPAFVRQVAAETAELLAELRAGAAAPPKAARSSS